jgi:enamine deaminase RidA (YjgF/YER057c/UK114 family)
MNIIRQLVLSVYLLLTIHTAFAQQLQHINPSELPVSKSYTQVVVVAPGSRMAYISGQVSANTKGEIMHKGNFRAQTTQVYENLKTALAAVGATFADVVKLTTFVVNTDADKIGIVREVRSQFYTAPNPPASTYVGVQGLYDKDVMIEIEAIAVLK